MAWDTDSHENELRVFAAPPPPQKVGWTEPRLEDALGVYGQDGRRVTA